MSMSLSVTAYTYISFSSVVWDCESLLPCLNTIVIWSLLQSPQIVWSGWGVKRSIWFPVIDINDILIWIWKNAWKNREKVTSIRFWWTILLCCCVFILTFLILDLWSAYSSSGNCINQSVIVLDIINIKKVIVGIWPGLLVLWHCINGWSIPIPEYKFFQTSPGFCKKYSM